jgi:transcriptional regulator of arginine metabolism
MTGAAFFALFRADNCINIWWYTKKKLLLHPILNKYANMKVKNNRLEALRLIISSQQFGSQEELLTALQAEGYKLTQATLSRDLKQLKVAKAATMSGNYIYVLPNDTMYKRISTPSHIREMMKVPGFVSINFSGNMGVIKTRPGYASSIAWNIDNSDIPQIIGTIAGDDTIFIVIKEGFSHQQVIDALSEVVPNMK